MTDAEKIAAYDQIVSIVEDHFALMKHQEERGVSFESIEFAKVNAYRKIAELVTGVDPR